MENDNIQYAVKLMEESVVCWREGGLVDIDR